MASELLRALARRRSHGEDVFENLAVKSNADAGTHAAVAANEATGGPEMPPWLEGAVFVDSGTAAPTRDAEQNDDGVCDDALSGDGLPPWFAAAVETGVVFYDPEGREVVVPSSQVPAFKAALETVNEFEPEPCRGPGCSFAPTSDATGAGGTSSEGCGPGGAAASTETSGAAAAPAEDAEEKRRELKANLQKRYFALLRSGLEPNAAAARAILEAAGHAAEEKEQQHEAAPHTVAAGESTQQYRCFSPQSRSDVSVETSSDSRRSSAGSTEIAVAA